LCLLEGPWASLVDLHLPRSPRLRTLSLSTPGLQIAPPGAEALAHDRAAFDALSRASILDHVAVLDFAVQAGRSAALIASAPALKRVESIHVKGGTVPPDEQRSLTAILGDRVRFEPW
jgi:hypothetical protein